MERTFDEHQIIVSKTDLKGRITYANTVFLDVSRYSEDELLGKPHNVIRHPDMPRIIFKVLWDTILRGDEIFAYVKNLAADGAFYWVLAHVTPSFGASGEIDGFHSNRRSPSRSAVHAVESVYSDLLAAERQYSKPADQMAASGALLASVLEQRSQTYDEFIWSVIDERIAA